MKCQICCSWEGRETISTEAGAILEQLRVLFCFISGDAALWYQQNHVTKTKYHVKQRFRFLSTPVWRHAPENTLDFPTVVIKILKEGSVPADCKNTQHLLLLTGEGTELSFRMTNTCFQFLVFVVLGSHCCYCCKKPAAGWCLWNQGKETQSGRDGWGCCGCQGVSWGVCVKPHVWLQWTDDFKLQSHVCASGSCHMEICWFSHDRCQQEQRTSGIPTSVWWLAIFLLYLVIAVVDYY